VKSGRRLLTVFTSSQLAEYIAVAALEKKAGDVVILDLRKLETLTDFFVICTGDVDQHVRAIADHIVREMRARGERVLHREGMEGLNWVLLDYVNVVVHVFRPSFREFYRLEDLWGDADVRPVTDEEKLSVAKKPRKRAATKTTKRTGTVKAAPAKAMSTKSGARPRPTTKTVKKVPKSKP
jgi:ribosome-associated protein